MFRVFYLDGSGESKLVECETGSDAADVIASDPNGVRRFIGNDGTASQREAFFRRLTDRGSVTQ